MTGFGPLSSGSLPTRAGGASGGATVAEVDGWVPASRAAAEPRQAAARPAPRRLQAREAPRRLLERKVEVPESATELLHLE